MTCAQHCALQCAAPQPQTHSLQALSSRADSVTVAARVRATASVCVCVWHAVCSSRGLFHSRAAPLAPLARVYRRLARQHSLRSCSRSTRGQNPISEPPKTNLEQDQNTNLPTFGWGVGDPPVAEQEFRTSVVWKRKNTLRLRSSGASDGKRSCMAV